MRFMEWASDGGEKSGVKGFWFIELKKLFSVVLLRFNEGSREAYHTHAFNAITWVLKGEFEERKFNGRALMDSVRIFKPSLLPKITPRSCFHKVVSKGGTWALSFRGPWIDKWHEYRPLEERMVALTHGRKEVESW